MAITEYGGTVIECLSTDTKPDKPDGWFCKELDSGLSYIRKQGAWTDINLGLAFIKATKSGSATTDINGEATITFQTPFLDDQYTIVLGCDYNPDHDCTIPYKYNKTANGFAIIVRDDQGNPIDAEPGVEISWLATRDYNP
jgi:hypothetical protein